MNYILENLLELMAKNPNRTIIWGRTIVCKLWQQSDKKQFIGIGLVRVHACSEPPVQYIPVNGLTNPLSSRGEREFGGDDWHSR